VKKLIVDPEKCMVINFNYSKNFDYGTRKIKYNTHIEVRIYQATNDKTEIINWVLFLNKLYAKCIYYYLSQPKEYFDDILNKINKLSKGIINIHLDFIEYFCLHIYFFIII
jgi:hypothetical protein